METANIPAGNNFPKNTVLNMDNNIVEPIDSIVIYEHICERNTCKQILTLNLVDSTPVHLKGWELVQKRELITVGISIGNGYFNKERLEVILTGMANYFSELVVIIPDVPALHSYRSLGYEEHIAEKNVKKHKHRITSCCESIIAKAQEFLQRSINYRIITWCDNFSQQEYYKQAYGNAIEAYHNDSKFRESIQRNTEHYILARLEGQDVQQLGGMRTIVEKAVYYLIEEIAFHSVFHIVLGGEPILSYYRDLELIPNYSSGKYGNYRNDHIGCITYNIVDSE